MDERPHDQGPGDAPARDGVPEPDGAAGSASSAGLTDDANKPRTPPASAVPYALWPRAAGGGAGAVSVPIAFDAGEDVGCRVADSTPVAPERVAEPAIDTLVPPEVSWQVQVAGAVDQPALPVGADGAGIVLLPAVAQALIIPAAEPSLEPAHAAADAQFGIISPDASVPSDPEAPPFPLPADQAQEQPIGAPESAAPGQATSAEPEQFPQPSNVDAHSIVATAPDTLPLQVPFTEESHSTDQQWVREPEVAPHEAASPLHKSPLTQHIATIEPSEPTKSVFSALTTPVFEPRPPEPAPQRPPEPASPPPEPIWSRHEPDVADRAYADVASGRAAYVPTSRGPAVPAEVPRPFPDTSHYVRRALRMAAAAALSLVGLFLALVILYRWVNPPLSTLMLGQSLTGTAITQRWVPLERMSPYLPIATIMSEDARFCSHGGVDWGELEEAFDRARDGVPRGGSTISMQVVKNLFLWPSKSYLRKAMEIPLTFVIEAAWPKRRIIEIYLNIAEWGPGVFGAEAAARYHFRKPAALLSAREAALLAVSLPNPFERQAGSPGPGTNRLADNLLVRMRAAQRNAACTRTR